jgi:ribose 5-phosphate isomerase A
VTSLVWESAKRRAASKAVEHVEDGQVIGLGSGSTVEYAVEGLGRRIEREGLRVKAVPSSIRTSMVALEHKVPLTTLDEHPQLDLAIDGADQLDFELNLIKGRGGALTREKIVDSAAKQVLIIVDERKLVEKLGNTQVPVEVLPFAVSTVLLSLRKYGEPRIREGSGRLGPVITDNGNFVVDLKMGPIEDPKKLEVEVRSIPGVVEVGLFTGIADLAYVGCKGEEVKVIKKR